jgi:hypothetical protein
MMTAVKQRANIENLVLPANSVIIESELRGYVNEAVQELYDLLIASRGVEYNRKDFVFTTFGNQAVYPLPSDFYSLISCDLQLGANVVLSALPYMEFERNHYRVYSGWYWTTPVKYRLLGNPDTSGATLQSQMISFIPAPSSITTVVLHYFPVFRKFLTDGTEDANVFDGVGGWEGHVIWNVAAMCLEKLKQDSGFARAQVEKYTARIEALAPDRHAGDPERVHDSLNDIDGGAFGFSGLC